jgi:hypothetical protein
MLPSYQTSCNHNLLVELKNIARWFHANNMAVNVSKTKFIIFRTRGKRIDDNNKILYDGNEPDQTNPQLNHKLERVHENHPVTKLRSY